MVAGVVTICKWKVLSCSGFSSKETEDDQLVECSSLQLYINYAQSL